MDSDQRTVIEKVLDTRTATKAQSLMRSKYGTATLAFISFVESLLPVPILTDPFLAGAIMLDRTKARRLVIVTMVSSVVGGFVAYLIALFFKDALIALMSPEVANALQAFVGGEEQSIFILTILGAVTPVPYTIIAWAIAFMEGNPFIFILGSILGRTFRYGVVGWCAYKFGPTALTYAKRSILLTSIVLFILAAVYIWLKM